MHSENRTLCWAEFNNFGIQNKTDLECVTYRSADKSLARPGRKQATVTEDFDVHMSYLLS
jgi:hypothetical protein